MEPLLASPWVGWSGHHREATSGLVWRHYGYLLGMGKDLAVSPGKTCAAPTPTSPSQLHCSDGVALGRPGLAVVTMATGWPCKEIKGNRPADGGALSLCRHYGERGCVCALCVPQFPLTCLTLCSP